MRRPNSKLKTQNLKHAAASRIRHYLLLAAVALGLVGSFLLPNAVAGFMDARRLDNLIVIDAQSIEFDADPELTLQKRIALEASSNTQVLVLATGQTMERETAEKRAVQELSKFFTDSPFEFNADECVVEEGSAAFVINSVDPTESMITWEFRILDQRANETTVTIDDETGVILKIIYRQGDGAPKTEGLADDGVYGMTAEETYAATLRLSEMMTTYYGLPVGLGDYQFVGNIAYYMASMYSGYYVTPLYGVVRATGFSMNERL